MEQRTKGLKMKIHSLVFLIIIHAVSISNSQNIKMDKLVIAHRGTTYWAPEETEAAMRWARNTGADYLEFDLQRTKDGILIALHDNNLLRTTDVATKFPEKKNLPVSEFTYEELLSLDAGTWFNNSCPSFARKSFTGLDILTLKDVVQIAEGFRVRRDKNGKRLIQKNQDGEILSVYERDPVDNGNRPGLYIETKVPNLFPGIEDTLKQELIYLGWYNDNVNYLKKINVSLGKIDKGNTSNRVILQTFSMQSLFKLNLIFSSFVPKCILLWRGNEPEDIMSDSLEDFKNHLEIAKKNGATIAGPSISGEPNNYFDLLTDQHFKILMEMKFEIHGYSFDSKAQFNKYSTKVSGMFTNQAGQTLKLYQRSQLTIQAEEVLVELGYK